MPISRIDDWFYFSVVVVYERYSMNDTQRLSVCGEIISKTKSIQFLLLNLLNIEQSLNVKPLAKSFFVCSKQLQNINLLSCL